MIKRSLIFLLFTTSVQAQGVLEAAAADLRRLPSPIRQHMRYLTMQGIAPQDRADAYRVLTGHFNGLSTESDIVRPAFIGGDLIRVNLEDYSWKVSTWERLAETDPYFHVQVTVQRLGKLTVTPSLAPWLSESDSSRTALRYLISQCQSQAPLLRADWFFNRTAAQADRSPTGYYDFLGVKNEADFQRIIGFDAKRKRRRTEIREAVNESGVTLQPRAIVREVAEDGGYWRTFDFRKSLDKTNPLRVLNGDIEAAFKASKETEVASEQYGHLANGFWATFLANNKGASQDTAPDFIAADHVSRSNDRRIHVNVSCIRCHSNGGLQPIDGWARNLFQPPLVLQSPDYATLKRLRQQYLTQLEPWIERDRTVFASAVREATGWDTVTYAGKYAWFWERYEDARVDALWAASDWGLTRDQFIDRIKAYNRTFGQLDLVVAAFLKEGRQGTVGIRQYEEIQGIIYLVLKGTQQ